MWTQKIGKKTETRTSVFYQIKPQNDTFPVKFHQIYIVYDKNVEFILRI
jgi:hypothetical protein